MNKSFYKMKNDFHSGAGNKEKFIGVNYNIVEAPNWIYAGTCGKSSLYITNINYKKE